MAEITIIDGQIVQQDPAGTGVNVRDGVLYQWEATTGTTSVSSDIIGKFDITDTVQSDLTTVFDIRGQISSDIIIVYDMAGKISSELICVFDLGVFDPGTKISSGLDLGMHLSL